MKLAKFNGYSINLLRGTDLQTKTAADFAPMTGGLSSPDYDIVLRTDDEFYRDRTCSAMFGLQTRAGINDTTKSVMLVVHNGIDGRAIW